MFRSLPFSTGIKDLSLTIGGRVGALIIALAFQAILARSLGPSGRGAFEAAMLFGSLLFLVFNFGAEMSSLHLISSKQVGISSGISNSIFYVLVISATAICAGVALLAYLPSFLDGMFQKGSNDIFLLGLLLGFVTLLSQTVMAISTSLKLFKVFSFMLITERVVGLVFLVFLVLFMGYGISGGLISIIVAKIVIVVLPFLTYYRRMVIKPEWPQRNILYKLFSYGSRFYFGKLSNQINLRIGPLILLLFASREELGFYGQSLAIAIHFMIIPDALYMVMLPRASEDPQGKASIIAQAGRINLVLSLLALVGVTLIATPFFNLVLSEVFLPSVPLFKIMVLGFALRSVGKTYEPYLIGTNQPGRISIAIALGAVINLALIYFLMPIWGLQGAAWAMVGNYGASTAIIMFTFITTSKIGLWKCIKLGKGDFQLGMSLIKKKV